MNYKIALISDEPIRSKNDDLPTIENIVTVSISASNKYWTEYYLDCKDIIGNLKRFDIVKVHQQDGLYVLDELDSAELFGEINHNNTIMVQKEKLIKYKFIDQKIENQLNDWQGALEIVKNKTIHSYIEILRNLGADNPKELLEEVLNNRVLEKIL